MPQRPITRLPTPAPRLLPKLGRRSLALAALLPLLLGAPAQAQNALDEVIARKQINIAIPADFPPYCFVGADLKPGGPSRTWNSPKLRRPAPT